jgi:hypothetical protein
MKASAALEGNLAVFHLADVLTFLGTSRGTGMLTLTSDTSEAYVFLRAGAVVYAASNQESLRLGSILLRKKQITKEQAASVDSAIRAGKGPFGEVAVESGVLSEEKLNDALKIQSSEVVYDAFLWNGGSFAFYDGFDLPPHAVTIAIDLANLIMEGARHIEEWDECLRLLPDAAVVFRVVTTPETEKITLSLDEWRILFLINGQRTLEDVCRDSDDDALHVYRVVYGLFANKLIERVETEPEPFDTSPPPDETMRQALPVFGGDSTIVEMSDDTNLLVSSEAHLSYHDVVKPTIAQIMVVNGDSEGKLFPLTEAEIGIGRQRSNEIQLADLGASGKHARLYRGPDGWVVEDLKSRNGTWLNNTRVFHSVLSSGDLIRIGATDLRFEILFDATS